MASGSDEAYATTQDVPAAIADALALLERRIKALEDAVFGPAGPHRTGPRLDELERHIKTIRGSIRELSKKQRANMEEVMEQINGLRGLLAELEDTVQSLQQRPAYRYRQHSA